MIDTYTRVGNIPIVKDYIEGCNTLFTILTDIGARIVIDGKVNEEALLFYNDLVTCVITHYNFGIEKLFTSLLSAEHKESFNVIMKEVKASFIRISTNTHSLISNDISNQYLVEKLQKHVEIKGLNDLNETNPDKWFVVLDNHYNRILEFRTKYQALLISPISTQNTELPPLERTPFKNQQHYEIFKCLVENWDYDKTSKWTYIWEYFKGSNNQLCEKSQNYEDFVKNNLKAKGKFNWDAVNSDKTWNELKQVLIKHNYEPF